VTAVPTECSPSGSGPADPSAFGRPETAPSGPGPLALAGLASLAGGVIHAAAIGVHAEHRAAARTFAVLALLQLGWGVLALVGRRRSLALLGLVVNGAALGGWVLAKTRGISFVDGLGEVEGIQWPDALAAAAAAAAALAAARVLLIGPAARRLPRPALGVVGVGFAAVSLVGMGLSGTHSHAGSEGHVHTGAGEAAAGESASADGHTHAVVATPYDPTKPIDLGGTAGVTPEEQARAENLIAVTLADLPRYADQATAIADGFHSIGDGFTGYEHLINWAYISDDHELDPDYPESLVYSTAGGKKTLVSAMFMLSPGTTLDDVPDLGGALTQWHIHDDLCFSDDPKAPQVAGVTSVGGECRAPLVKLKPVPMIHVWIVSNPCGPFAALEGTGAGQIKEGEERLCDSAHGHGA